MKTDKYSENIMMTTERGKAEREYWINKLQGEAAVSSFPTESRHSGHEQTRYSVVKCKLPDVIFQKVIHLCNNSEYAVYMFLLSGVKYLLHRYTASDDIIVGMPAFKQRVQGEYADNILALRTCIEADDTFKSLLGKIKNSVLEADKNQNFPLNNMAELLNLQVEDRKYRFNTIVLLDNIHRRECLNLINADTIVSFLMADNYIELSFEYDEGLFGEQIIHQITEHLINCFNNIVNSIAARLSQIEVLSQDEKHKLIFDFNYTFAEYQKDKCIHQLFEEQVERTPDNVAAVYEGESLTYRQLNEKANRLGRALREKGIKPDSIAGIMVERSLHMPVGIMGVLKAGGAYLPLDPSYPEERISYMLEDSKTEVLLTQKHLMDKVKFNGIIIDLEDEAYYSGDTENLVVVNNPDQLAYIIYTSGSTGKPKGVMVEHRGIANLKEFFNKDFGIRAEDRILQFASSSFDASVWETFMALLSGAALYIASVDTINNPAQFEEFLNKNNISVATLPPTYLANLNPDNVNTLKRIITAGSATYQDLVKRWSKKAVYINAYGPTETTICTTTFVCDEKCSSYSSVPIGKPIFNTGVLILDKYNRPVPVGVAGELCVSGDTLARGYLNRPELTAEKFIPNPFRVMDKSQQEEDSHLQQLAKHPTAGSKFIYKTGDLARWLPDGNIELLGRIDHQVKVRGYRIELGEIESQLLMHQSVKEALVMARDDQNGDKYLCAYIVCQQEIKIQELREYLSEKLPDYMVPSFFVQLDYMPLTPNGKIDRKALPEPGGNLGTGAEYVEPRNEIEVKIASVWEEVLGTQRVGIRDSFFELGGDSIKAIQVLSRLNKHRIKLEMKDIFRYKTIEELSQVVTKSDVIEIDQGPVKGEVFLTPIQNWFFEKRFTNMSHWNQSVMLYGKTGFDAEVVEKVFNRIMEHHDALRMVYRPEGEHFIQYNRDTGEGQAFTLDVFDFTGIEDYVHKIEEEACRLQGSIDLENGPLVKLGLFKTSEGDHLLIVIHHLVIDGVSWRIVFEDFAAGYAQEMNNEKISFQDKTHSFREWSSKLKEYAQSKEILSEIKYWSKLEEVETSSLPVDNELIESNRMRDIEVLELSLTGEETEKLLKQANKAYNTEINDLLLAALGLSIKEWAKQDKVLVSLEGHGREEIVKGIDITRTIGWFTSQYPVMLDMSESADTSYLIRYVKENLRKVPNKGIGYGILRYLTSGENKHMEFRHNPEISFNYLGQFGQDLNTGLFGLSHLNTGEPVSPEAESIYKLNINGMVANEKLVLAFSYNRQQYSSNTILKLIEGYRKNLGRIVEHCIEKYKAKKEAELTPSDVGCMELSLGQFEKIYNNWGDNIKSIYALSPTQEGILFHAMLDNGSHAYFEQTSFTMKGNMDVELFQRSFNTLIDRHDILKTIFVFKHVQKPLQVVLSKRQSDIYFEDVTHLDEESKQLYMEEFKLKDRERGFDLSRDVLIRAAILKTGEECYKVIWSFHHILMDGWCLGIINREQFEIYSSLKNNMPLRLGKAPVYRKYIDWLEKQDKEEAKDYWLRYLEGYENLASVPKIRVNRDESKYIREEIDFTIDKAITDGLSSIARRNNTTLNTVFQAIWGVVLQRYNNTGDVVFGAVLSGRSPEVEDVESMIGLFINTVPVRVQCEGNVPFTALLGKMQNNALEMEKYSYYPLADIQASTPLKGALLDHIIVFENFPIQKSVANSGSGNNSEFVIEDVQAFEQTNFDFNIIIMPAEELNIRFTFNSNIYDKSYMESLFEHIRQTAVKIIESPEIEIGEIEIINQEEKKRVLFDFNNTKAGYPENKCIHQLFEEQVERTPDNIALLFGDTTLTYRQFNNKANQLAGVLRGIGVKPGSIVGIMLERSFEMMIGIMGVLKAGGAYLPIDPEYPADRIKFMLEDSGAGVLLINTQETEDDKFKDAAYGEIPVTIINLGDEELYSGDGSNLHNISTPNDLAYVIYTSGSTGKPKGVLIEHTSAVNILTELHKKYPLGEADTYLLKTTYTFDVSVAEIFGWFHGNGRLAILEPGGEKNPQSIIRAIETFGVTHINFVPSMFNFLLNMIGEEGITALGKLKYIFVAGEAISGETVRKFYSMVKGVRLENIYGPTEATIYATGCSLTGLETTANMPIGKPLQNVQVYILDKNNRPQPVGVPGELCIAGVGVARGYLNRPELTAEKFILNPFSELNQLMYRTGDLARWLPDGNIEFLGRMDYQIKIRGYRIELGEIESELMKHDSVKEAVVVAKDGRDGNKHICAYIVSDRELTVHELREHMLRTLPDYMVPSYFVKLESMPLTSSGKANRRALPDPDIRLGTGVEYAKPTNDVEKKMVDIWQQVLNLERVGIDDNFFELGGNSLSLITVVSMFLEAFDVELSPRQLFETPTIRILAQRLDKGDYKAQEPLLLLNRKTENQVFCFPPIGGYGLVYKNMADMWEDYSCYSFNYIDDPDMLKIYVEQITQIQKEGPYVLLGWSAGGNLAFEVAKEMERQNHIVSDLILVDVFKVIRTMDYSMEQIKGIVEDNLRVAEQDDIYKDFLSKSEFVRKKVASVMESYTTYYFNHMINSDQVDSNIHLIRSTYDEEGTEDMREEWCKSTTRSFIKYQGIGDHGRMLYTGFIEENGRIIMDILNGVFGSEGQHANNK